MPHILLTNDDGIHAPGLAALAQALRRTARLTIVAPDSERSASSGALTTKSPLRLQPVNKNGRPFGFACSGTPVDSVKLAVHVVCRDDPPDLVISGINQGGNMGSDVHYSGTVAAALDGALMGFPAIAVSLCEWDNPDFTFAARFARTLARKVLQKGLPTGTILNVNVPAGNAGNIQDVRITRQGRGRFLESFDCRDDPRGVPYYWIGGERAQPVGSDTDEAAITENIISITPLKIDLTHREFLPELAEWNLTV